MSVLSRSGKTRGLRNFNPGNIRRTNFTKWLGLSSVQNDDEYCQFDDMKFGIRAFLILCRTYRRKYGIIGIPQFLNRYAPLSENDTLAYIKFCIKYCGSESLVTNTQYYRFACAVFWYESRFCSTLDYVASIAEQFKIDICKK